MKPKKRYFYLNNKKIFFKDVLEDKEIYGSKEELLMIAFCKKWLLGEKNFVLHTSGSTGTPKQITLTRKQMEASAKATIGYLSLNESHKALVCINTAYIGGIMMLVRCLVADMLMIIVTPTANPLENSDLAEIINVESKLDFIALVPLQLQTILTETPEKKHILDNMQAIIVGGAALSQMQENLFKTIIAPVFHTYGMTETVSHIALRRINPADNMPTDDYSNDCLNDYFQVLPKVKIRADKRGCLIINAESSNFEDVITNDLVEILTNNQYFKVLGRIDNIINSGGVKIQLEKIEQNIANFLSNNDYSTKNYYCMGLPDDTLGQRLVIVFEGGNLPKTVENNLLEYLKKHLTPYEIPKEIVYKNTFERTETGKIIRK